MEIRNKMADRLMVGEVRPFAVVHGRDLELSPVLIPELPRLQKCWDEMPLDGFTTAPTLDSNPCKRSRMYSRCLFDPCTGQITVLPAADFTQGDNNGYVPGQKRKFAPIPPSILSNALLQAMVRFTFAQFDVRGRWLEMPWHLGMHPIRTHGIENALTDITPEGAHSDGFGLIAMWHLRQSGLVGDSATTKLYIGDEPNPSACVRLSEPLDCIFADDRLTRHAVTPLRGKNDAAFRDALVFTWHLEGDTPYPNRNPS